MFGDIVTDLGGQLQGGMGLAASGNLNPGKVSMFEPVHGSAPDIAGQGIANPIGMIWSGAMMLEHLGEVEAANAIVDAIERVLSGSDLRTRDMGGRASTEELGHTIAGLI
jgi:tartrate dehydrogenase/decarboxylase/D-malate dehydrogenase